MTAIVMLEEAAAPEDRKRARDIVNQYSVLSSKKTLAQLKDIMYYVIVAKEGVVGITGYRPSNDWCVEQVNTVILPEFRSKGYASAASVKMEALLWARSYGKIFCTVRIENAHMIQIKQRQGFVREGLLKDHFGPGRSIYVFGKYR